MYRQPNVQSESGTFTGTGAVVNISLTFKPQFLFIYNETDGDACWVGIRGAADDSALQITNHADTQLSFLSSDAITFKENGFSVGTSLSESAKVMRYFAI